MSRKKPETVDESQTHPSVLQVGFKNCCPACGKGKLLTSLLNPGKSCDVCGLDYGFIDAGDGPAVFVIFILGFFVTGLATWFHFTFMPPVWVHILIWPLVIVAMCIWGLRFSKCVLIALQYQTKAQEGTLEKN